MAQHDQVIDNGSGLTVRTDFNAAIAALFSNSSGPVEPSVTVAGQFWWDTANASNPVLRQRNLANTGWMTISQGGQSAIDIADGKRAGPPNDTFVWNDKLDMSGTDVMTLDDIGNLSITGALSVLNQSITSKGITMAGGNVALAGGSLLDPMFAPASAPTKKAHLDLSAIVAGQDRTIRVPNMNTATGIWEPIFAGTLTGVSTWVQTGLDVFCDLELRIDMTPDTAATGMAVLFSTDSGTSWVNSGYTIQMITGGNSAAGAALWNGITALDLIHNSQAYVNGMGVQVTLNFREFNKTKITRFHGAGGYQDTTGQPYALIYFGCQLSPVVMNAMALSIGTACSGTITLVGRRG